MSQTRSGRFIVKSLTRASGTGKRDGNRRDCYHFAVKIIRCRQWPSLLMAGVSALPAGRRRTELRKVIDKELGFLFADRVLPFGERSAEAYAQVVPAANAAGNPIDFADAAIGAIAIEHGYLLATRNLADFKGTPVKLLNPWS